MFTLPELPYEYDALEPYIDQQTMQLHHAKHHQTYVDKLNTALKETEYADRPIEDILQNLNSIPESVRSTVRNNGGGHYNHSLFWKFMAPNASGKPDGQIARMINSSFGSYQIFQNEFVDAAVARFGSGWVWLIQDDHQLEIASSPNQDSPIMQGITPLLGLDVWEHAYYLKYQNKRPDYIAAWWNVVNWEEVNNRISG